MRFDDRLCTVLRNRAEGPGLRRIQYRQLLDLLGTSPAEARGEQIDAAFVRLSELSKAIPCEQRAAILGEHGLRLRSPRLVATLAAAESAVARAALTRAQLAPEQWLDLLPALHPAARVHLRARHDLSPEVASQLDRLGVHERGLPAGGMSQAVNDDSPSAPARPVAPATQAQAEAVADAPVPPPTGPQDESQGIGALVRKIEAYRKQREGAEPRPSADAPRLPLGEDHVLAVPTHARAFDFATNPAGQIVWSDPGVAPMVTGLHLGARDGTGGIAGNPALLEALRRRQPIRAQRAAIAGAPAVSGKWQIDAAPWFDPLSGRHMGWRGRMRRLADAETAAGAITAAPAARDTESDRIRQMLHELRTPVNAIQGFAEVIQQQLFGPTPHEYRALASTIVGDAARMLSAFEELERLAKLDSAAIELEPGDTDAAEVLQATIAQLSAHTRQRGSGFDLKVEDGPLAVGLARLEMERIAWRLLATLAGICAPGELLKARLRAKRGVVRFDIALPAQLSSREGDDVFQAAAGTIPQVISAGVFGVGFALRLARAEAKAAGGSLIRKNDRLRLELPGLTRQEASNNLGYQSGG
ncbi:sensor histidine kinase [Novosphingobium sp.]|uniref:sensor histidine kinase n=1 Tax=Novosphingobium sp. TaxID=1874826 RepID=UPI0035AEE2BD